MNIQSLIQSNTRFLHKKSAIQNTNNKRKTKKRINSEEAESKVMIIQSDYDIYDTRPKAWR